MSGAPHFAKLILCLSLMLTVFACTRAPRQEAAAPSPRITAANFGDDDPHPELQGQPDRYPVHGIDVSRFQGQVNWSEARANGVNFAFLKATEGGDGVDPLFTSHWQGAAAAGVLRGGYHVFYHCRPAIEQARWFIAHVPREAAALPPVLDIDWTPTSPTCRSRRDPETIRAEVRVFVAALTRHYNQRPIVYATLDFFHDNELGQIAGADFWLWSVAAPMAAAYPGQSWTFWQYSSTGLVPGIAGPVDLNTFAGSRAEWAAWVSVRR